jgi:glyoxylase-like metal-dependent hydrolase (beta-lactamase superfamily II)
MKQNLHIEAFYDTDTFTYSYLVMDTHSRQAALIDSVLDYDAKSARTGLRSADALISRINALHAQVIWLLETHVHADHLSAAPYLKQQLGGEIAIGEQVRAVQQTFGELFNCGADFARDGRQFDRLLHEGEQLELGEHAINVIATPGHTPACVSYLIDSGTQRHIFVGDTLFMPDFGTARCDFPGGDAGALYDSIQKLLNNPGETLLYLCHDYPPATRTPQYQVSVAEQRARNIHIHDGISRDDYVAMRKARDATLAMPVLLLPSVQINMRAGHFPEPESNGIRYLKLPLNAL